MSPYPILIRLEIHGPATRDGPEVKLFDLLPCNLWLGDIGDNCVSLTDAQLRDVLNGRYTLFAFSDAFPRGFLSARIYVPDGDGDGISDILDHPAVRSSMTTDVGLKTSAHAAGNG